MTRSIALFVHLAVVAASRPKILCLHGGGGSADSMSGVMSGFSSTLGASFEFVYASISSDPNEGELWWADPPGGKGQPTTDPNWASAMVSALDTIVTNQGPFYGIVGYSQGAAAVPVYLSQVPTGTFQMAIMFNGYVPTTHLGLVDRINGASPFGGIRALVFMGVNDGIISNPMSQELATKFSSSTVLVSTSAGHEPPGYSDPTFNQVVSSGGSHVEFIISILPKSMRPGTDARAVAVAIDNAIATAHPWASNRHVQVRAWRTLRANVRPRPRPAERWWFMQGIAKLLKETRCPAWAKKCTVEIGAWSKDGRRLSWGEEDWSKADWSGKDWSKDGEGWSKGGEGWSKGGEAGGQTGEAEDDELDSFEFVLGVEVEKEGGAEAAAEGDGGKGEPGLAPVDGAAATVTINGTTVALNSTAEEMVQLTVDSAFDPAPGEEGGGADAVSPVLQQIASNLDLPPSAISVLSQRPSAPPTDSGEGEVAVTVGAAVGAVVGMLVVGAVGAALYVRHRRPRVVTAKAGPAPTETEMKISEMKTGPAAESVAASVPPQTDAV